MVVVAFKKCILQFVGFQSCISFQNDFISWSVSKISFLGEVLQEIIQIKA